MTLKFASVIFSLYLCSRNRNQSFSINPTLYGSAQTYAEKRGLNLSELIENFFQRLVASQDAGDEQAVPDVVLSLLGAGEHTPSDDLNGRQAYYQYLEEKYQ